MMFVCDYKIVHIKAVKNVEFEQELSGFIH